MPNPSGRCSCFQEFSGVKRLARLKGERSSYLQPLLILRIVIESRALEGNCPMPLLKSCLISPELASAIRTVAYALGAKVPKSKRGFRCPTCKQPVKPMVSADGKLESHFEHFPGARHCEAE